jgi:hypothetical protein
MIRIKWALIVCLWVGSGSCPPVSQSAWQNVTASPNVFHVQPRELASCLGPVDGNPDLYGIGIRVGIYLQLFSTLIANHYLPEAMEVYLRVHSIHSALQTLRKKVQPYTNWSTGCMGHQSVSESCLYYLR